MDIPLQKLIVLASSIFVIGMALTLPIYKFDYKKFVSSTVFIKIIFWIPIFIAFLVVLYANHTIRLLILIGLMLITVIEFLPVLRQSKPKLKLVVCYFAFIAGLSHLCIIDSNFQNSFNSILITICIATVMADVVAYFAGNYLGKHKLPKAFNSAKSWEGVAGEVVGSLLGVFLVNNFVEPVYSLWMFLPIGIGSAIGDLANSYAKRQAGIKEWSQAVPGHGGFIDRLCSLAGSSALLFYFLELIR